MKNNCLLLCATALSSLCFYTQANASINFNSEMPPILNAATLHTQHIPHFKPKHLSSLFSEKREIKVAQVCFITDTDDCGGADFVGTDGTTGTPDIIPPGGGGDDEVVDKSCIEMGFTKTSCTQPYLLNKQCPVNDKYYAECICPANYEECDEHYYGVGLACDGKYAECECNTCEGYDYTESNIPKGYVKDKSCESCNGWKYTIKPNPCDGYKECANGPASGASSCLSGNKILYSDCQNCDSACPEGTTESNPGGCGGSTKNGCGDKTCYYPYKACCTDECPSYTLSSASSCSYGATSCYDSCYGKTWYKCNDTPLHTHSYSCPSGYQASACSSSQTQVGTTSKVCSCGATSGTCYKCKDKGDPCAGVSCPTAKTCSNGCKTYSTKTDCCASVCTECKTCTVNSCSGYTLSLCPSNGNCSSCVATTSDCKTSTKYKLNSCKPGYTMSGNSCVCSPAKDATGCKYGTYDCDDGCGGTRKCCKAEPKCSDAGYYGGKACSYWTETRASQCQTGYRELATSASCAPIMNSCNCTGTSGTGTYQCYANCLGSCDVDSWRRCCEQCAGGI